MKMRFGKKENHREHARRLTRIGKLLTQGYSIDTALHFIQLHSNKRIVERMKKVKEQLKEGKSIQESMQMLELPPIILSILYFYERQGDVAAGFLQAGALYEKREVTKEQFRQLMRYPIILAWLCLLMLLMMNQFIVPHFETLFVSIDRELPKMTRTFLFFFDHIPFISGLLLLGFLLILLFSYQIRRKWSIQQKVNWLLKIPILSRLAKQFITYYFSLQLGRLLSAGLTLQEALFVFEAHEHVLFFQEEAKLIRIELKQGEMFRDVVERQQYFLNELANVIENGEHTGTLGKDLQQYSEFLYQLLDDELQKAMTILQPAFFILVGGFVFALFLSVLLPMFQMIGSLH